MNIQRILSELKKPFPASEHKERFSLNGSQWFYIPWPKIRDRLDKVCPDWQVSYSDPITVSDYIIVRCKLTIAGITREATGDDKAYLQVNESGNLKAIGTPTERAMANAFVNAAEQFGIGAYLDDRQFVNRYLHRHSNEPNSTILTASKTSDLKDIVHLLRNLQRKSKLAIPNNLSKLPSFEVRSFASRN